MANNFDVVKKEANTVAEGSKPQLEAIQSDRVDEIRRPSYNSQWTRQTSSDSNSQINSPPPYQPISNVNNQRPPVNDNMWMYRPPNDDANNQVKSPTAQQSNIVGNNQHPLDNNNLGRQTSHDSNSPLYSPGAQSSSAASNKRFGFFTNVAKSFTRSYNPYEEDNRRPVPPSNAYNQPLQGPISQPQQPQVHIIEQQIKPYWEGSFEDGNQEQAEGHHDEGYGPEQDAAYYQDESYNYQKPYKKKGLTGKISRLVKNIPGLGKMQRQTSQSSDKYESDKGYQHGQPIDLANADQSSYELTPEELALHERYADKTRTKLITLETKDESQPVDIRIHPETKKIYLCDIGRSVIEIYDFNGTLQHIINDSVMNKFKPTAIAVAFDGTIIIASYFSHYLQMHAPNPTPNNENIYSYKLFKLGSPGIYIHQFQYPAGITIDQSDGYLYICDRGNFRIQVMNPDGICERVIELVLNSKKKQQLEPVRIAHQKKLDQLVCILGNGDVLGLIPKNANGQTYVDPFYVTDEHGVGLENATGLAVDADDRIFISDTGHDRIVVCRPDGNYITSFGRKGTEPGELQRPCGIDITNDGNIVVTEPGNKRLQLFGLVREEPVVEDKAPNENPTDNPSEVKETEAALIAAL